MENSNQLDELLVRYLTAELSTEEEAFVISWINASEENLRYFEALKNTWQLTAVKLAADNVNVDAEWNHFKQAVNDNEAKVISLGENEQQPFSEEYLDEERTARRSVVYRMMVAVAVAASVLLVIGLGWRLFNTNRQETPITQEDRKPAKEILATVRHEVNTSGKPKTFLLQDGSQIVLWDQSEVSFEQPFAPDKRHINLKGKADFKVAKDQARPFTVFSGDLSTTALGTEFTVTAFENATNITVRLYEGKVVVKPVDRALTKMKKDVYLLPGQELIYDNQKMTARVRAFGQDHVVVNEREQVDTFKDDPSIPKNKGTWYMFNKQSLSQVFDQLAELYDVEIIYSKKDVQNMQFLATYDKSDSLETILNNIAILNNLTVKKDGDKYIIEKKGEGFE
jgi:ferric-dicitrate binding protein FerR (iron transport regulator)